MDIPKPKIEDRAIRALENIIDEHLTMQSQFNRMDKEMSWDGYIWIFQKCGGQNKENFDDKVPVQIKGHIDKEQKYINKTRITYSVKITDLKVYFRDRGILYFEIFMSEDGKRREIFYSSLFPSKLKSYIETAEKKGNKEYINISFSKLEKTANKLYIIVKQFSNESRKQGFGIGPTVQNTIMVKDMEKVTSITASAVGVANRYEFLQRLSEGDVCLYGTLEGCPISFPLEWYDNSTYVLREKIHQTFGIENRVFYEEYEVETTSNDSIILIPSENLEIDLTKGKFRFKENSSIKQLRIDAEFLLCAMQNTNFTIGNTNFQYGKLNMPKTLEDKLEFYIQLDDVLQMIEFNFEKPFKSLSKQTKQQLVSIVAMKNGLYNKDLTDQRHIFNWKIEDKYMPVIVSRHDNDEKNDLMNAIYTRKHQTFDTDEKGHYFRVPLFVIIDRHILDNLYYYDYAYIKEQIDKADVNEYTLSTLNYAALQLINVYDATKDKKILDLAEYQLSRIENLEEQKSYYLLNMLQIKYRKNELSMDDKKWLLKMETEDNMILFGRSVLLQEKEEAEHYYGKLTDEDRESIHEYPIMYLYQELCQSDD